MLRALFRPPQSTRVQKVVAPLLDAGEEVLREKAAAVLGKVIFFFVDVHVGIILLCSFWILDLLLIIFGFAHECFVVILMLIVWVFPCDFVISML